MKECKKCLNKKALSEFWKCKHLKDGLRSECKDCLREVNKKYYLNNIEVEKERRRKYYQKNREKFLERSKIWALNNPLRVKETNYKKYHSMTLEQKEKALERKRKFDKTQKGRLLSAKYRQGKKWIARYTFRNAIRDGKIKKVSICQVCLSNKSVEGHHADYDKPLVVVWLCKKCHSAIHQKLKKEASNASKRIQQEKN